MFSSSPWRLVVKTFQEAAELASVAQRSYPRLASVDHLAVDVTSLAASAARFTREFIGHERDEEAVKILAKTLSQSVLRRIKVKKSIAFFMDGTDPLWKVHHLRQYPGKVFDKAFYRSAGSPLVYLIEDHLLKTVEELRGSSPVLECVVAGPSTPGPAAVKMSAWLLDLSVRAVPPAKLNPFTNAAGSASAGTVTGDAPVSLQDSIVLVGDAEDVHLNAWGASTWTPTPPSPAAAFTILTLDQRDAYSLTLADSLEWLTMGDVYRAVADAKETKNTEPTVTTLPQRRHALAAVRTDAVLLYLLAHGSSALGLPALSNSITFTQWMTAYGQEMARQAPPGSAAVPAGVPVSPTPTIMGKMVHEYPRLFLRPQGDSGATAPSAAPPKASEPEPERAPLSLNVEALRRVLASAAQRPPPPPVATKAGNSSLGGRYHPGAEHYLEVLLQSLHAYTHGFIPDMMYNPPESKAHFGERGMRGVTAENILLHLQYLAEQAPLAGGTAAPIKPLAPGKASLAKAAPVRFRRVGFTPKGAETPAAFVELFTHVMRSPSRLALTGAQQLCLCSTKAEYMQQVLPVMTRGHVPTTAQVSSILEAKSAVDAVPHVQKLLPPLNGQTETESEDLIMDGALRYQPTHYVTRSGAAALSPWQYYSIHLGLKAEVFNIRCTTVVEDPSVVPRLW